MSNWDLKPRVGPLTGTETQPVNQAGVSKHLLINDIADFIIAMIDAGAAAATSIANHLAAYAHGDIAHANRAALDLVDGTNTGDQDLSGYALTANVLPKIDPTALGQLVIGESGVVRTGWANLGGPIRGVIQLGTDVFLTPSQNTNNCINTAADGMIYLSDGYCMRDIYSKYTGYRAFQLFPYDNAGNGVSTYLEWRFSYTGVTTLPGLLIAPAISTGLITNTTATLVVDDLTTSIIANYAGTTTLTLPAAASYPGRILEVRTIQAQTVVSAASNVVPLAGGAAGTAILAATAGKWAKLQSDGANWQTMMAN